MAFLAVGLLALSACGSGSESDSSGQEESPDATQTPDSVQSSEPADDAAFPAVLGEPATGYLSLVDLAVRRTNDGNAATYAVEQGGMIRLVADGGAPGEVMADLSLLTRERGERGLLGLAFSSDGSTAYVNYTDLDGRTTVDALPVGDDGAFDVSARETIYTLDQPYNNHNGGDLILSPDGRYLFVFNGDGGSADDPERLALDPTTELGKIVRIDLDARGDDARAEEAVSIWASGLRNPWRAYLDPETQDLWVADVGQNMWEEINVLPLDDLQGVSFGWSAYEGTEGFNEDQLDAHSAYPEVRPIHTYPHENEDCSISGGAVYRGESVAAVGTWYLFSDFCSGAVRALCVTPERTSCGVETIGKVENPVAILPDASGELWVVSLSGRLVPIIAGT
jgi:glucose/arabinose dehydrogenase